MRHDLILGIFTILLVLCKKSNGIYQSKDYSSGAVDILTSSGEVTEHREFEDPLRHHVDFDELHPGEDLIAEESGFNPHYGENQHRGGRTLDGRNGQFNLLPQKQFHDFLFGNQNLNEMFQMRSPQLAIFNVKVPWWAKRNVCESRIEEEGNTQNFSSQSTFEDMAMHRSENPIFYVPNFHIQHTWCEPKDDKFTCIQIVFGPNINKTITTEYECCQGYILNNEKTACEQGTLESIINTMSVIGGKEFSKLVEKSGLQDKLNTEYLTVIVPTDEAIKSFLKANPVMTNEIVPSDSEVIRRRRSAYGFQNPTSRNDEFEFNPSARNLDSWTNEIEENVHSLQQEDWIQNELVNQQNSWLTQQAQSNTITDMSSNDLQQLILGHLISGKLSTDDFVDEKVVFTQMSNNGSVRLNTYSTVGKTVNCAPLISTNHQCSNGIIHMIDRVLQPATYSIADVIDSTVELSILRSYIISSGLLSSFQDSSAHFTVLAPSNIAFNKLSENIKHKFRSGDPCLKRILRNHILPFTLCSVAIRGKGQVRNINHRPLEFERTMDDKILINNILLKSRDIITENGVIHFIDEVILFDDDQPLTNALQKERFTSFLELCSKAGIKHTLDELENVTIFAPTNDAFNELPEEIRNNPMKLKEILSYHIVSPEVMPINLRHGQKLATQLTGREITINLHSKAPLQLSVEATAQCGLLYASYPSCNGIIYKVDRVLIPPEPNIISSLHLQSDLKVFLRIIQEANFTSFFETATLKTVFAPKDSAFYSMSSDKFRELLSNFNEMKRIVETHVIEGEYICCTGIGPRNWMLTRRVRNLYGHSVPLWRNPAGQVMFGNTKLTSCDLNSANGVIHVIDGILESQPVSFHNPNEFMASCFSDWGQGNNDGLPFVF